MEVMRVVAAAHFYTCTVVDVLKQVGPSVWSRDRLKMKTPASCSVQDLIICLEISLCPAALHTFTQLRVEHTLLVESMSGRTPGESSALMVGSVFCWSQ